MRDPENCESEVTEEAQGPGRYQAPTIALVSTTQQVVADYSGTHFP